MKSFFSLLLSTLTSCFLVSYVYLDAGFVNEIKRGIPRWMEEQITEDLLPYKDKVIHLRDFDKFLETAPEAKASKFIIRNNKVYVEDNYSNHPRPNTIKESLETLCQYVKMPNVVLVMSQHDGVRRKSTIPLLGMSRSEGSSGVILIPDFEALREHYQVLKNVDITRHDIPWSIKVPKLVWRGSTAQHPSIRGTMGTMKEDTLHLYSRFNLCNMSLENPELIDAKFTRFAKGTRDIPQLKKMEGVYLPFSEEVNCKYHIILDGTASSYSCSGWKFFINSLVFKEDSEWSQWYFKAMIPNVHYVPVQTNLTDLMEKLQWALEHDAEAEKMAKACTKFARTHLTIDQHLAYLYWLVQAYSKLNFVE